MFTFIEPYWAIIGEPPGRHIARLRRGASQPGLLYAPRLGYHFAVGPAHPCQINS
jgi:hypothetical protein